MRGGGLVDEPENLEAWDGRSNVGFSLHGFGAPSYWRPQNFRFRSLIFFLVSCCQVGQAGF